MRERWRLFALRWGIWIILLAFMGILAALNPNFLTVRNLTNVLTQVAPLAMIAIGTTLIILLAEIDLSVGSVAAFAGAVAAGTLQAAVGGEAGVLWVLLSIAAGVGVGVGLGFVNGALTVWGGIPSFIVTLGMLSVGRGLTLLYTGGRPIFGLGEPFDVIAYGRLAGIPMPIVLLAVAYTGTVLFLHFTQLGRYIYAIGSNQRAVELAGVAVRRIKIAVFAVGGALAGFGGVMIASRLDSAQPTAATAWELDAIAAVVLGGTSLYGGRGSVARTFAGAVLLQLISNGLNLLGVQAYWQQITKGLIILVALLLERALRRGET